MQPAKNRIARAKFAGSKTYQQLVEGVDAIFLNSVFDYLAKAARREGWSSEIKKNFLLLERSFGDGMDGMEKMKIALMMRGGHLGVAIRTNLKQMDFDLDIFDETPVGVGQMITDRWSF